MLINLNDAVKKYGKGEAEVYALNKASFSLDKGKVCVILGPSGSGKSTLLNILGGLDSLDSGTLEVAGEKISEYKKDKLTEYRKKYIGFVFQFYNLIPDLTVEENIEVVSDIAEKPLEINEVLEALGIKKYSKRFPKELSGGQQQRVAIARAMIKNPEFLLCDELTGALDSKSSKDVLGYVEKMNEKFGTTVIIITHNEAIAQMADVIVRLKDGEVVSSQENESKLSVEQIEL